MKQKNRNEADDWDDIDRDGLLWRLWQFGRAASDPIPDSSGILREIVRALLTRIEEKDQKSGKWCRWIVQGLAARDRYSQDCQILSRPDACSELHELSAGKPHAPSHNHGLIKLQYEWLHRYFLIQERHFNKVAESSGFSICSMFQDEKDYIYERLSLYACLCDYAQSFDDLRIRQFWGKRTIFIEILGHLHKVDAVTIESLLKPENSTRPPIPPPLFIR